MSSRVAPGSSGQGQSSLSASSSRVERRPQTPKDAKAIARLYRIVLRTFYDDKFVVIGEQVLRWQVLPADVLAGRLGVQTKEMAVLAAKLVDDKMLCHFKRNEKREGITESKMLPRNYYHFHAPLFLAMLKYRLHHIRLKLDSSIVSSSYTTSFVCPQCRFHYTTLDVAHLLDASTNSLRCERPGCGAELQEDEEEGEETKRGKQRMRRFNEQSAGIIRALESLEGVDVETIDPAEFLADPANHKWKSLRSDTMSRHQQDQRWFELPDSQATSMSTAVPAPSISLTDATSSAAALQAARDEADRQRKENAIPEWLGKSTVSGQETALGIKERLARERADARLGRGQDGAGSGEDGEDEEEDYYAQYAQMQAQQEAEAKGADGADGPPGSSTWPVKRSRDESYDGVAGQKGARDTDGNKKLKMDQAVSDQVDAVGGQEGGGDDGDEEDEDLDEVA